MLSLLSGFSCFLYCFFFFNDTATTEIYTLSLHDALPIYSQAGAQFGYSLLWTMIPITIALVVVQEMAARMGAVTGKGLSDLIREEFGFRLTFIVMVTLVITNFGNRSEEHTSELQSPDHLV